MLPLGRLIRILALVLVVQVQVVPSLQAQEQATRPLYGHMALGEGVLWYLGGNPYRLHAIDPNTGKTLQTFRASSEDRIGSVIGHWCFVQTDEGRINAYDSDKDQPVWSYTSADDVLILGADPRSLYAIEGYGERGTFVGSFWTMTYNAMALDVASGSVRWRYPQSGMGSPEIGIWGIAGADILVVESRDRDSLYGLNGETGDLRWIADPQAGYSIAAGRLILDSEHKAITAVDPNTGDPLWLVQVVSDAVEFDGGVSFVSADTVYGVYQFPDTFSVPEHYLRPSFVLALDSITGEERWRFPEKGDSFTGVATSIIADGETVYLENKGRYFALHVATGELIWQRDAPGMGSVTLLGPTSVIVTSEAGSSEGTASINALSRATGELVWSYQTDEYLREQVFIGGGQVFALSGESGGDLDTIVAINEMSGDLSWQWTSGGDSGWMRNLVALAVAVLAVVFARRFKKSRKETH